MSAVVLKVGKRLGVKGAATEARIIQDAAEPPGQSEAGPRIGPGRTVICWQPILSTAPDWSVES